MWSKNAVPRGTSRWDWRKHERESKELRTRLPGWQHRPRAATISPSASAIRVEQNGCGSRRRSSGRRPLVESAGAGVKGPGLRIDLDVRREWRCTRCGRTVRTPVFVTAQRCSCSSDDGWMQLQQPAKREPYRPPPRAPEPPGLDDLTAEESAADSGPGAPIAAGGSPAAVIVEVSPGVSAASAVNDPQAAPTAAASNERAEAPPDVSGRQDAFGAGVQSAS